MKKIFKFLLLIICIITLSGCNTPDNSNKYTPYYNLDLRVYFIDVGQADCSLIMLPTGEKVLIDAGLDHATSYDQNNYPSWINIENILSQENIRTIDYLIITHNHLDHYAYVSDIIRNYNVKSVYMSGSTSTNYTYLEILETINKYNIPIYETYVGQKIVDKEKLQLQVVSTQKIDNPEDANITSVCTKLTYDNISFLFMGDAGYRKNDGESIALNSGIDLKSDVLKVGHHGSPYSSSDEFMKKVSPKYAVITTADKSITNHPYASVISRLKKYSEIILQSKDDGTILFVSNGNTLDVYTHIGE